MILEFYILFLLIIATIKDIKERRIPNWITFSIIVLAIFFAESITSLVLMILIYIAGRVLYDYGMWGGGDAKLMTGMIGFIPLEYIYVFMFLFCMLGLFQFARYEKNVPFAPVFLMTYAIMLPFLIF